MLENSLDPGHRLEDPHSRSQVSFSAEGTNVVQHEPYENATSSETQPKGTAGQKSGGSLTGQKSDLSFSEQELGGNSADGSGQASKKELGMYNQGVQVYHAADGTRILQHAPTALPPNKYNVTSPVPGLKPTQNIHAGIQYPKANSTKVHYREKDGTRITQFNTGIKENSGTMNSSWEFIPNEYVPGFSDDDGQPNAAGYKYRNRPGEKEKGNLIKEQVGEAVKENNPSYQYDSEEKLADSFGKSGNKTNPNDFGKTSRHLYKTSTVKEAAKSHHSGAVLYDVRPLKPHHFQDHGAAPTAAGQKRGSNRRKHHENFDSTGLKQRRVKQKRNKRKKARLLESRKKSPASLDMMPLPDLKNTSEATGNQLLSN